MSALLIPARDPDGRLERIVEDLAGRFDKIVVVDDGSVSGRDTFDRLSAKGVAVLRHETNRGKGAAIKTGLAFTGEDDVVTADADGQHSPQDIVRVADALAARPGGLVLGVRSFRRAEGRVPFRSRFGNFWTRIWFFAATGMWLKDTQTGLRGIPASLVRRVAALPGERFEYEMVMLADAKHHPRRPLETPISTIYVPGNKSHHRPFADTWLIYKALFSFVSRRNRGAR